MKDSVIIFFLVFNFKIIEITNRTLKVDFQLFKMSVIASNHYYHNICFE